MLLANIILLDATDRWVIKRADSTRRRLWWKVGIGTGNMKPKGPYAERQAPADLCSAHICVRRLRQCIIGRNSAKA